MRRVLACLGMAQMIIAGWVSSGSDSLSGRFSMTVAGDPTGRKFFMSWSTIFDRFGQTGCAQYIQSGTISDDGFIDSYSEPVCIRPYYRCPLTALMFPYRVSNNSGYLLLNSWFSEASFQGISTDGQGVPITAEYNLTESYVLPVASNVVVTPSNTTILFYYWGDLFARMLNKNGVPGNETLVAMRWNWSPPTIAVIGNLTGDMLSVAFAERGMVKMLLFNSSAGELIGSKGEPDVVLLVTREPDPNSFTYERAVAVTHPVGIFVVYCGSRNNETEFVLFGKLFESNGYKTLSSFEFASDITDCSGPSYSVGSSLDTVTVVWTTGKTVDLAIQSFYMTKENGYSKASSVHRVAVGMRITPRVTTLNGYQDRVFVVWSEGLLLLRYFDDTESPETEIPPTAMPTSLPSTSSPFGERRVPNGQLFSQTVLVIFIVTTGTVCLCSLVVCCWYQWRKPTKSDSQYNEMYDCSPKCIQDDIPILS
eukprot:TRINITY_DN9013_c0_g2_i2.p1 TRINITY_DN9013_c0_g2~~TRINITY_DN9013_c0_g2_i2.p1  ORF type:complete len:480 (+),score=56.64 TRINITY_DN9013_c0_g2_i2:99-1538(+)